MNAETDSLLAYPKEKRNEKKPNSLSLKPIVVSHGFYWIRYNFLE